MGKIKHEVLSYKIRGACYEVYNTLGPGYKESIYHNALAREFKTRKIRFTEKARIPILYKNEKVGMYEPDFIIDDKVLIEVKAVSPYDYRFFWSRNEVEKAQETGNSYYLYLLPVITQYSFDISSLEIIRNPYQNIFLKNDKWNKKEEVFSFRKN